MSRQQEQLFIAWNKAYPVSPWERQRNDRIARVMEIANPFVTGAKVWTLGYKPSATRDVARTEKIDSFPGASDQPIRGNKKSKVYHLPLGCPGYQAIKASNIVQFEREEQARKLGYRKAGNCR